MTPFTPDVFVVGIVPASPKGDPFEPMRHDAARCLDDEALQLVAHRQGDRIAYIAAPARQFTGFTDAVVCPLSAALPGAPGHRGEGAYLVPRIADLGSAVFFQNGKLESYAKPLAELERMAAERGLPVYPQHSNKGALAWQGDNARAQAEARRTARSLLASLALVLALVAGAHLAALSLTGMLAPKLAAHNAQVSAQLAAAAGEMQTALARLEPRELVELDSATALALRYDGRLARFETDTQSRVSFRLELPLYAPSEAYAKLGPVAVRKEQGWLVVERVALSAASARVPATVPKP